MKKAILILFGVTFLLEAVSCNKSDKMSMKNSYNDSSTVGEMQSVQPVSDSKREQQENDYASDDGKKHFGVNDFNIDKLSDNYLQIIKSEKPFLLMGEEVLLEHYKSPYLQKYLNQCDTVQYTVLDMDGDGEEEVLIRGWTDDILVLHEEDGVVYGFDFTFREMYNVKTDGSYCWNANQGKTYGCSKLLFRNGTCFKIELSRVEHTDNGTDRYFVNGTEVDREVYDSFTESCADVDCVTWYPLYLFPKNMEDKG